MVALPQDTDVRDLCVVPLVLLEGMPLPSRSAARDAAPALTRKGAPPACSNAGHSPASLLSWRCRFWVRRSRWRWR